MVTTRLGAALLAGAFLAGCRTAPRPPLPPPTPPVARPALSKTFGVASNHPSGGLSVTYKDLRIAVNEPDSALDFLLVTAQPKQWPADLRRDIKIIAPADAADNARKSGFANAKALGPGQRLMLSKTGAFLFVSATQQRNPATGRLENGYLLEFDNGRNLYVSGAVVAVDPLREFVYGLRDDGKELHLIFVPARASEEARTAELVSLLQPEIAVVVDRGGVSRALMADALAAQIFGGSWYVAAPSDNAPF